MITTHYSGVGRFSAVVVLVVVMTVNDFCVLASSVFFCPTSSPHLVPAPLQ